MIDLALFGVGSHLIQEYEESCRRLGCTIRFGVRNRGVPDMCSADVLVLRLDELSPAELDIPCLVPLFTPRHRMTAVAEARNLGFNLSACLIDPSTVLASTTTLGDGCFVNAGSTIGATCFIGHFVTINRNCAVGHHNDIGDFVSIGPSCTTCGNVSIGLGALIGAGSVILPGVKIGEGAVIGAGSVISKDVAAYTKVTMKRQLIVTQINSGNARPA
jgi:sugar O-acyltransferase (sialic acid O-acetyltransferase NeuD family)